MACGKSVELYYDSVEKSVKYSRGRDDMFKRKAYEEMLKWENTKNDKGLNF